MAARCAGAGTAPSWRAGRRRSGPVPARHRAPWLVAEGARREQPVPPSPLGLAERSVWLAVKLGSAEVDTIPDETRRPPLAAESREPWRQLPRALPSIARRRCARPRTRRRRARE